MPLHVLVVDDSHFFQHRLAEIIDSHPDLKVIGVASNGREAVEFARTKRPDVITMDYEMPLMDGVTAVREIMASNPIPILMLSSLTYEGARITLDALDAGAVDFLPKNFADVSRNSKALRDKLHQRLLAIGKPSSAMARRAGRVSTILDKRPGGQPSATESHGFTGGSNPAGGDDQSRVQRLVKSKVGAVLAAARAAPGNSLGAAPHGSSARSVNTGNINTSNINKSYLRSLKPHTPLQSVQLLAIGASTGGPVALLEILRALPARFSLPILLVQHMPANFTRAFAERLNQQCKISVCLAEDGATMHPGTAYLAPGGKQMIIDSNNKNKIKVLAGDDRLNYKPSVDITFASAANVYGAHLLAVVLTGMGSDGCKGCRLVKEKGGHVWTQDQDSSVIYGMPMAVARENLTDRVLSLSQFGPELLHTFH